MPKLFKRCGLFFIILLCCFNLAFTNQGASFDLEHIVITKNANRFLSSYSLAGDSLNYLPFNSFVEALSLSPLDLQSRTLKSGIQTDFSLRGSGFQGVLVLVNGQRLNDPQTAHHNSDLPFTKEDIQKIEVIPGVSSALFGPDAIGGAINILLKEPQEKKMVLEMGIGQHQSNCGLFSISKKLDTAGMRISLENQESAGFYYDTDFKKFTASANSYLEIPDGKFNLNLGYQEKEFGAYDFYTPKSGYASKEWTKTYLLGAGLDLDKEGFIIKPALLLRRHFDKFLLDKTLERSRYLNHHRTDIYTPNIYFQKETAILGKTGLGLEYSEEKINSTNLGKYNRARKSIFVVSNRDLTDTLSLGSSLRSDDFDGFGQAHSGSLNLKYELSQTEKIRLGVSRSIRIPSFTELYYNDPTTLGDANLSEENALTYEAGYAFEEEKLSGQVALFLRQEEDFIDWIKRTPAQARWQVENITEAEAFGIESHLKLKISRNLGLDSNYTYINKRINDQGFLYKYGPNYIRHLINSYFNLELPFGIESFGFTYKKKPGRDGWFLLSTHFSYDLNKNLHTFLNITNLLNVEYQEIEGIPQPGRFVEAGIRAEW